MSEVLELEPRGPFSLRSAAEFGFGPNAGRADRFDGVMRLAFALDGGTGYAGAVLRQEHPDGVVTAELQLRDGEPETALRQIARIVSLDHDGERFERTVEQDPVIGMLVREHRGQRPVLFHSPYEGAAWAVISARRPANHAAVVRAELAERLGATFELAGQTVHAFPQPQRLLGHGVDHPALGAEKSARLLGIAQAAADGALDVEWLHELGPERSYLDLQRLKGIGPFYAGLVVMRASGFADAPLLAAEPKVLGHAARLYGLDSPPSLERFAELAAAWRPFRTWAIVLIRLAGDRAATQS